MVRKKLRSVSLFTGAGGMDIGFGLTRRFSHLFSSDILPIASETFSANRRCPTIVPSQISQRVKFPFFVAGDIADIDFDRIRASRVDVIYGGPPCQDFSVIRGPGKERQGIDVNRGRLYGHFIRALIHLQPRAFVFENVPGLKSANGGAAYNTIQEDFSNLVIKWEEIRNLINDSYTNHIHNYSIIFSGIVNSAHLGVPQGRRRLLIIGIRDDLLEVDWLRKRNEYAKEAESTLLAERNAFKKYPLTPLEVFEGLPLNELAKRYREIMQEYEGVGETVGTPRARKWQANEWPKLSLDVIRDYHLINGVTQRSSKELDRALEKHERVLKELGYYKRPLEGREFPDMSNTLSLERDTVVERQRMIPPNENCEFVRGTKWEVEGRGISLIYRRIHPIIPSYTVVAYGGGGTWGYHYQRARCRLTNRERARLQSFPDKYVFCGNSSEVRAQIGEAVPPLLGKEVAGVLARILPQKS